MRATSRAAAALVAAGVLTASSSATAAPGHRGRPRDPGVRTASVVIFQDAHEIGPVTTGGQDRGSVSRLATVVDRVRASSRGTDVVFAGDLAGGTLFGGVYHGHPMVEAFNQIGVDLASFGQHDFDFGVDNTRQLVAESDFPWISSNLTDVTGRPFVPARWAVHRVGGIRVGYVGLTDGMATTGVGDAVRQHDLLASARSAVAEMERCARPDVVVAVTQASPTDGAAIATRIPQVDAVFIEETSEYDPSVTTVAGKPVVASEGNLGSVIRLDLRRRGHRTTVKASAIEVDASVPSDPRLKQLEDRYLAELDATLSEVLARLTAPLTNSSHEARRQENALGDLVADAFRAHHGTDVAWVNGGGLRAEATGATFTKRDAYAILPFGNKVVRATITGAALRQSLEQAVAKVQSQGGGFPQVSGMSYAYRPTAPVGARVAAVTVGGQPLDEARSYSIAATSYVLGGGDGVTAMRTAQQQGAAADAPTDAEVLVEHARRSGTITPRTDGRITVLP